MKDFYKRKFKNKKDSIIFLIGIISFAVILIAGAFAYVNVFSTNGATTTNITGTSDSAGSIALTMINPNLYLNLNAYYMDEKMSEEESYLYASNNSNDEPIIDQEFGNGIYTLAKVNYVNGGSEYNCHFKFNVSIELDKEAKLSDIVNNNNSDIYVNVYYEGYRFNYSLENLIREETITDTIDINNIKPNTERLINASVHLYLKSDDQDYLENNNIKIKITPVIDNSFYCEIKEPIKQNEDFDNSIRNNLKSFGDIWQSPLPDDGYRYVGTQIRCDLNNQTDFFYSSQEYNCPDFYNVQWTDISDGYSSYYYDPICPEDDDEYTYNCTNITDYVEKVESVPRNYICFGTYSKTACLANKEKYLYRIVGFFKKNSSSDYYTKLVKYKPLPTKYAMDSRADTNVSFPETELKQGLNGSYFLTNADYDYLQNNTWLSKIENWPWTINTDTDAVYYDSITFKEIYLFEFNKTREQRFLSYNSPYDVLDDSSLGQWTTMNAKIGLLSASDVALAYGSSILNSYFYDDSHWVDDNWLGLYYANNFYLDSEWFMDSDTYNSKSFFYSRETYDSFYTGSPSKLYLVRPSFYISNNTIYSSGIGTFDDPYIIR